MWVRKLLPEKDMILQGKESGKDKPVAASGMH
jgi:hypothetical protein